MKRGFTLIELLVVIAIIGLLSSVVLASLNGARSKAQDAQRLSNLREVEKALQLYATDNNGKYPIATGWSSTCAAWVVTSQNNAVPGLSPTYMSVLPIDPQVNTSASTCCYMYYSDGNDYKYMIHNCPTSTMCYGSTESKSIGDPERPTWSCAVYTPGATLW